MYIYMHVYIDVHIFIYVAGKVRAEIRGPTRYLTSVVDNRETGRPIIHFIPEEEGFTFYIPYTLYDNAFSYSKSYCRRFAVVL